MLGNRSGLSIRTLALSPSNFRRAGWDLARSRVFSQRSGSDFRISLSDKFDRYFLTNHFSLIERLTFYKYPYDKVEH